MPLYEFKCSECGHKFELLVRNSRESAETCPQCGAKNPEKLFSAFAVGNPASQSSARSCDQCASAGSCPYKDR